MNNTNKTMTEINTPLPLQSKPEWAELYQRLQAFQVAAYDDVPLSFQQRLMREHGWTAAYVERVWFEYKRFLFMLATTERFICPAEDVDQIWHTHLIYTRSYWNDLCRDLIGKPLHHVPSPGGQQETANFYQCYAQTLERYQALFGEKPPADIWVEPQQRLKNTPYFRLVNTRTHWLLKKPAWFKAKWLTWLSLGTALGISLVPNVYAYTIAEYFEAYLPIIAGIGFILLFVFIISAFKLRCPNCKKMIGGLQKTGRRSNEDPPEYEYRCKACNHRVWRARNGTSLDDGGSGGSSGGCGGSGG